MDNSTLESTYADALVQYKKLYGSGRSSYPAEHFRMSGEVAALRVLAAYEIRLKKNITQVLGRIERAIELKMMLFDEFDKGRHSVSEFVGMGAFHFGLDAFAVGCGACGRALLAKLGGRERAERLSGNKFIISMGYAVKELILSGACTAERLSALEKSCKSSFSGYTQMIEGISSRNRLLLESGLGEVLKGHKILARPGGLFDLTPDAKICFWALGLVNFAILEGMNICVPKHDLLPEDLLEGQV